MLGLVFTEEELAVVAAEEEGEAVQVGPERVRAVGGWPMKPRNDGARVAGSAASQRAMSWRVSVSSIASAVPMQVRGMTGAGLVLLGGAVPAGPLATDPLEYQAGCVEAFVASWRARGFSPVTIENDIGLLDRTLRALGRPAWEVTPEDIDRVVGDLAVLGRASSTRREYVQIFKGFHRFLQVRKAAEIEAAFGVRLVCPVDEFNAARHVGDDSPAEVPPPIPERVEEFFGFLKTRIATARKYAPAARDYALFRALYHAGLRSEEATRLDRPDVHFGRGPFGKLHNNRRMPPPLSVPFPLFFVSIELVTILLVSRWYLFRQESFIRR